jgi:DNA-binding PadR family transcriptional regulator
MSGYDVKQFLERTVVHFWSESPGQIYPALRRLEEEGRVEGRTEPGERGQEKRVYRITDAGRDELREWLRRPAEPTRPRYEHSLKLFFGRSVGPEASLEHIERLRRRTEETLAHYRERETQLARRAERDPGSPAPYWLVVLRGGIRYSEMVLEWCDETEETLRGLPEPGAGEDPGKASSTVENER